MKIFHFLYHFLTYLQIIFRALRGDSKDGYAAMDNIVFSKEITEAKNCEVKPAFAAPASCDVGQFECPSDHSCINIVRTHILKRNTFISLI